MGLGSLSILLLGVLPLIAYVIVDSFASLKWALFSACLLGALEFIFSIVYAGGLDWISVLVFILLLVMAAVSIKMNSPLSFKLQPAVVSLILGLILIVSSLVGHPIFVAMYLKYSVAEGFAQIFRPAVEAIGEEQFLHMLAKWNLMASFAFLVHAVIMWWAALKLSKWWWITLKAIGVYVLLFLFSFIGMFI